MFVPFMFCSAGAKYFLKNFCVSCWILRHFLNNTRRKMLLFRLYLQIIFVMKSPQIIYIKISKHPAHKYSISSAVNIASMEFLNTRKCIVTIFQTIMLFLLGKYPPPRGGAYRFVSILQIIISVKLRPGVSQLYYQCIILDSTYSVWKSIMPAYN